jgi:hypothetical protein
MIMKNSDDMITDIKDDHGEITLPQLKSIPENKYSMLISAMRNLFCTVLYPVQSIYLRTL